MRCHAAMLPIAIEPTRVRWRTVERVVRFLAGIAVLVWAVHDLAMR